MQRDEKINLIVGDREERIHSCSKLMWCLSTIRVLAKGKEDRKNKQKEATRGMDFIAN